MRVPLSPKPSSIPFNQVQHNDDMVHDGCQLAEIKSSDEKTMTSPRVPHQAPTPQNVQVQRLGHVCVPNTIPLTASHTTQAAVQVIQ